MSRAGEFEQLRPLLFAIAYWARAAAAPVRSRGGGAGADEPGGGQPGPGLLDNQARGAPSAALARRCGSLGR